MAASHRALLLVPCFAALADAAFPRNQSRGYRVVIMPAQGEEQAGEACDDTLAASPCESRRQACISGSDSAQCERCVNKLYCDNQPKYCGTCYGRGVACAYINGVKVATFCFPSAATVKVLEGPGVVATRRMEDLRVGDRVLTAGGFSEVYAFMDHAAAAEAEYLRLRTDSGAELRLTGEHIVFAHADSRPVLAAEVREGDLLWVLEGGSGARGAGGRPGLRPSRVVAVTLERARGAHAPLTAEGSLVVDGVLASSSAGVKTLHWGGTPLLTGHRAVMLVHAPLRFVCGLAPSVCGPGWHSPELGRHMWTQWVLDHLGWLRAANLEHHDLRVLLGGASAGAWAAASAQALTAAALVFLDAAIFSLSPWQALAVLSLLWMRGRHRRSWRKAVP